MSSAVSGSTGVVAYLALFAGIGIVFVFINLLIGRFLRPKNPHPEKLEIYECGEPTIGTSFVQFDLRFYVVALIFIIFDVEVAFLFPWATVFGKANHLMQEGVSIVAPAEPGTALDPTRAAAEPPAVGLLRELGVANADVSDEAVAEFLSRHPQIEREPAVTVVRSQARRLMQLTVVEVLVFFVILLIGFAYVWRIGALDWVRALSDEFKARASPPRTTTASSPTESILSA